MWSSSPSQSKSHFGVAPFPVGDACRYDVAGAALDGLLCRGVCWVDPQEDMEG